MDFIKGRISHYVLDDGRLVVAHAGMKEAMQGRGSPRVRDFALFGETTGETDEYGLPVRLDWAMEYRGRATVVYGHTPTLEAQWLNRTVNIDTGCVFGGSLTALRYPEKEFLSVRAKRVYCEPVKPLAPEPPESAGLDAQQRHDDLLYIEDITGKRFVQTRLGGHVTIREENAAAALEIMSRFAVDPKWLIYLPPTMSPCATSNEPDLLEHPSEAFEYYRKNGVERVVCEEKHMGSRAIVVVCRDVDVARCRFGVDGEAIGVCHTRTGRPFFSDESLERALLERLRAAMDASGFWDEFETDWACLDCELMPWSAKAQKLLEQQYAPAGAAASRALSDAVALLERAKSNGKPVDETLERFRERAALPDLYIAAYRQYCWPANAIEDYRLAPFHLLATEGGVYIDRDHVWHMEALAKICAEDPIFLLATPYRVVDLSDEAAVEEATGWWTDLTGRGGEGMVVKPFDFVAHGKRGVLQPAVKCRGREYLRIIYGMEYTRDEHLKRLKKRGLARKRSLAIREFSLGVEALERFARREPLRRVHECCFAVLALESEPVDPRL